MEKQPSYEQLIIKGIRGLPQDTLAEIARFVYFMRKPASQPQEFMSEFETVLLETDVTYTTMPNMTTETLSTMDEAGINWLDLAGSISQDDLQLMAEAIEAGCETVDLDEW